MIKIYCLLIIFFLIPEFVLAQATTTDYVASSDLGIAFILFLFSFIFGLYFFRGKI